MAKRNIKFSGWNWSETKTQLQKELIGQKEKVNQAALSIFADAQRDFIKNLPASEDPSMPFITGNLHDSIAGVISVAGGRVIKASFAETLAGAPSTDNGRRKFTPTTMGGGKKIFGHMEAIRAVYGSRKTNYPSGIAATLVVAVPYAENPNEFSERNRTGKHVGYLDILASRYVKNIEQAFRAYEYLGMFRWKGGSDIPQKYVDSIYRAAAK
jgi:hypothetical protein